MLGYFQTNGCIKTAAQLPSPCQILLLEIIFANQEILWGNDDSIHTVDIGNAEFLSGLEPGASAAADI